MKIMLLSVQYLPVPDAQRTSFNAQNQAVHYLHGLAEMIRLLYTFLLGSCGVSMQPGILGQIRLKDILAQIAVSICSCNIGASAKFELEA